MAAQVALRNRSKDELGRKLAAVAELKSALAAYAREHGGRFILFGSAARREMRPDSDVDILIDFPVELEMKAADFAEREGRRRGLEPDVLPIHWTGERLRARLQKEGLFLPGDEDRWAGAMSMEDRLGDILDAARSAATHFRAAGTAVRGAAASTKRATKATAECDGSAPRDAQRPQRAGRCAGAAHEGVGRGAAERIGLAPAGDRARIDGQSGAARDPAVRSGEGGERDTRASGISPRELIGSSSTRRRRAWRSRRDKFSPRAFEDALSSFLKTVQPG